MMTLNELIERLEKIRRVHECGDVPVDVSITFEKSGEWCGNLTDIAVGTRIFDGETEAQPVYVVLIHEE